MNEERKRSSIKNLKTLSICTACIIFNVLTGSLCSAFGLPFCLDTVGSIVAGVAGGYLSGVFVGFFTNIILSIFGLST